MPQKNILEMNNCRKYFMFAQFTSKKTFIWGKFHGNYLLDNAGLAKGNIR